MIINIHLLFPGDNPQPNPSVVTNIIATNNNDGTFTISGPDEVVSILDSTHFLLNSPQVTAYSDGSYIVESA